MTQKLLKYTLILGLFCIVMATGTNAQNAEAKQYQTWIDSASAAYTNQNYEKAVDFYQRVLDHGMTSADLHYNLGNAWYKQGKFPEAILHYEKALKYNPAHEDARVNLKMVNNLITDRIEPASEPFYKRWYRGIWRSMPLKTWTLFSIGGFIVLLLAILLFVFSRSVTLKKTVLPVGLLAVIVMTISLIMGAESRAYLEDTHKAVIFEPSLNVKSAPDQSGTDLFNIHEGLRVEIKQQLGEWTEIEIADGRVGWVPADAYKKI